MSQVKLLFTCGYKKAGDKMEAIPVILDYDDNDLARYCYIEQKITLNLKVIRECCDDYKTDFYTLLVHVLNHEYLHYIILVEHGLTACIALDKMTNDKQTNNRNWDYWLS